MSATTINTINTITSLHHRPQLEPVDLSLANTENQSELERFLQRVREGRTELTIQVKYFPGYLLKYFLIYLLKYFQAVESSEQVEEQQEEAERERLEILRDWSKSKKVHKCSYEGCDKVG